MFLSYLPQSLTVPHFITDKKNYSCIYSALKTQPGKELNESRKGNIIMYKIHKKWKY